MRANSIGSRLSPTLDILKKWGRKLPVLTTTMCLITLINLPVILLWLVVGVAAAPILYELFDSEGGATLLRFGGIRCMDADGHAVLVG